MTRMTQRIGAAIVVAIAGFVVAGCAAPARSDGAQQGEVDARFGDAVRQARAQQTLNPDARSTDPVSGIDGVAAQNAIDLYQKGFKEPPRTFNILGIGGSSVGQ
ncbi:MAG TPA: hypothetical protein VK052_13510 [Zeimonas sp.]|nr:hypothetical protein [Zeimonas sp.]